MTPQSRFGRLSATVSPISLLLLGAWLRLNALARDQRLHPDEALYADLARRIGLWGDWQLLDTPVDKPPLQYFVGGFFYALLGDSEFSTRLPNAFAGIISLALIYILGWQLTQQRGIALLTLLLAVLSPMHIAFSISNFTDIQMLTWMLAATVLLLARRWGWAGLALGCAIMTKPAALWWLPLMGFISVVQGLPDRAQLQRGILGIALPVTLFSLWDRLGSLGSFWTLGAQNYQVNRWIRADEILPRLDAWSDWLVALSQHGVLMVVGILLAVAYLLKTIRQPTTNRLLLWGMLGYCLLFLGMHWLIAFNTFDRYLMPILPLVLILMAVGFWQLTRHPRMQMAIAALILLVGIIPAHDAMLGKSPVASDQGQHAGIDHLATVINQEYRGEIFYEHWLGWELRYYLGADPQAILLYFPTADSLADYAWQELPTIDAPRYFVAPSQEAAPWLRILTERGILVEVTYEDGRYLIAALTVP